MGNTNYFPSTGFDQVLDKAQWQTLQAYLNTVNNLPRSSDPKTEAILQKVHAAAATFQTNVLSEGYNMLNTIYNNGQTIVATLSAMEQLLDQPEPSKPALENLVENLASSATSGAKGTNTTSQGMSTFEDATSAAGKELATRLSTLKATVATANETIASKSADLRQQLSAATIDPSAIGADMSALQQAVSGLSGISFVGLNVSVEPGVSSATKLAAGINAAEAGWNALATQLNDLDSDLKKMPIAKIKNLPGLSKDELTADISAWQAVANKAHDVMTNFYITAS